MNYNSHYYLYYIHGMTKQEITLMSLCDNSINKLTFNNFIQFKA